MKRLPKPGFVFVCGKENPHNIDATWHEREDGAIITEIVFTLAQEGLASHTHDGALAALLGEAMGAVVRRAGFNVALVNLTIDYHQPLPLEKPVSVEAHLADREGRAICTRGEIRLADGTAAVTGRGIYLEEPPSAHSAVRCSGSLRTR